MTLRTFGLLMLFLVSGLAGASSSLSHGRPQIVAEASIAAMAPPADAAKAAPNTGEPSIRVILPSPYEIRTN